MEKMPQMPPEIPDMSDEALELGPRAEAMRDLNDMARQLMEKAAQVMADEMKSRGLLSKIHEGGEITPSDVELLTPEARAMIPYLADHLQGSNLGQLIKKEKGD